MGGCIDERQTQNCLGLVKERTIDSIEQLTRILKGADRLRVLQDVAQESESCDFRRDEGQKQV